MEAVQRYVSNELSHFVGRGKTEEEQYDLLVNKILKTGLLTHSPGQDPNAPRKVGLDFSRPISKDKAFSDQRVVCFCDIPEPDLGIHVGKYSRFGLSFKKEFLIDKGASPVFYAANESLLQGEIGLFCPDNFEVERIATARATRKADRALYFDTSVRGIFDLLAALDALCCEENERYFGGGALTASECKNRLGALFDLSAAQVASAELALKNKAQAKNTARICMDFLVNHIFSFVKCFEAKLDLRDESNFYMEREWRVANNIQFQLDEVSRVFFPRKYAKRFRADSPGYAGQVSFID
jgi:hypothetical protein